MRTLDRKASAGDPLLIRAGTWNAVLDAAALTLASRSVSAGAGARGNTLSPSTTVLVRNGHAASVQSGGILSPTGVAVDPSTDVAARLAVQARPVLVGSEPGADTDAVMVVLDPLQPGGIGRAVIQGIAVCTVNVSDDGHEFARAAAGGTTQLGSAATGPVRILWRPGGTGVQAAVVLLINDGVGGGGDAPPGCHLGYDDDDQLYVTVDTLLADGKGLEVVPGESAEDCDTVGVKAGCNVIVDGDGVSVDVDSIFADVPGFVVLEDEETECKYVSLVLGCGLEFGESDPDEPQPLQVAVDDLAGDGLTAVDAGSGECDTLAVLPGCGLEIDADGAVGVDLDSIFGGVPGFVVLEDEGTECEYVSLVLGCGLAFGAADPGEPQPVQLNPDEIAGDGLVAVSGEEDECDTLGVKPGCNIIVDANGVSVDTASLVGDGLELFTDLESGCDYLSVYHDCTLTTVDDGEGGDYLRVNLDAIAGSGLIVVPGEEDECDTLAVDPIATADNTYHVLVTGEADEFGYYPCSVQEWDCEAGTWATIDDTDTFCFSPNDEELTNGTRYLAQYYCTDAGDDLYATQQVGEGGGDLEGDCGIAIVDGKVSVYLPSLVSPGGGLEIVTDEDPETCDSLAVKLGCDHTTDGSGGITLNWGNILYIGSGDANLSGLGIVDVSGESPDCPGRLRVNFGRGVRLDNDGYPSAYDTDTNLLEPWLGDGLKFDGDKIIVDKVYLATTMSYLGLTGGEDGYFQVGAGNGIEVDTDFVMVKAKTAGGITVDTDGVSVDVSWLYTLLDARYAPL